MEDISLAPVIQRNISRCLDFILHNKAPSPFKSGDYNVIKGGKGPAVEKLFLQYVAEETKRECLIALPAAVANNERRLDVRIRHALVLQLPIWMGLIKSHQPLRSTSLVHLGVAPPVLPTLPTLQTQLGETQTRLDEMYAASDASDFLNVERNNELARKRVATLFSEHQDVLESTLHHSVPTQNKRRRLSCDEDIYVAQAEMPRPLFPESGHLIHTQQEESKSTPSYDDLIADHASKYAALQEESSQDPTPGRLSCVSNAEVTPQQEQNEDPNDYNCTYSDSEEAEETFATGAPLLAVGSHHSAEDPVKESSARVGEPPVFSKPSTFTLLAEIRQQTRLCLQNIRQHNQSEFIKIKGLNQSALQTLFVDVAATLSVKNPAHSIEDVIDALSHRDDLWEPELEKLDVSPDPTVSASPLKRASSKRPGLALAKKAAQPTGPSRMELQVKRAQEVLDAKIQAKKQLQGSAKTRNERVVKAPTLRHPVFRDENSLQLAFERNESLYLSLLKDLKHATSTAVDKGAVQDCLLNILAKLPDMVGPFIEAYGLTNLVRQSENIDPTFHAALSNAIREHMIREQETVPPGFKPKLRSKLSKLLALPDHQRGSKATVLKAAALPSSTIAGTLGSVRVASETTSGSKAQRSMRGESFRPGDAATRGAVFVNGEGKTSAVKKSAPTTLTEKTRDKSLYRSAQFVQAAFESNEQMFLPLLGNLKLVIAVSLDKRAVQNWLLKIVAQLPYMTGPFIEAYELIELVSLTQPFDPNFHATVRDAINEHMAKERKLVPPGFKPTMLRTMATQPKPVDVAASYSASVRVSSKTNQVSKDLSLTQGGTSKPRALTNAAGSIDMSEAFPFSKSLSNFSKSELVDLSGMIDSKKQIPKVSIDLIDFRLDGSPIRKWFEAPEIIVCPRPNDVLVGRSKNCFNHPGNVRLRLVITHLLDIHGQMTTRVAKLLLNTWIINDVLRRNGRFLRNHSMDRDSKDWYVGSYCQARVKVGSAVRDASYNKVKCINLMKKEIDKAPKASNGDGVLVDIRPFTSNGGGALVDIRPFR